MEVNNGEQRLISEPSLPQELIRKGIPHHFRAIVWQLLGNATDMPVKNQYSELLKMSSPCEKLIRRDIARTYPEHEFFKGQDSLGQEVLFNVMKASLVCSSFETLGPDICSGLGFKSFPGAAPWRPGGRTHKIKIEKQERALLICKCCLRYQKPKLVAVLTKLMHIYYQNVGIWLLDLNDKCYCHFLYCNCEKC